MWCALSTPGAHLLPAFCCHYYLIGCLVGLFRRNTPKNRLSEKIYSGSEAVNGSVIIENRTKYLYYIIAARIVIRYQCITAWKAVLVPYVLFYSEKGLVKMRLIAKIYEIYDKYYATVNRLFKRAYPLS